MATLTLRHGDCTEVLLTFPEGSLGAVVCDPPYGLEFMGKEWDRLDWTDGGGMMSVGMGGREIPWPSYSGSGAAGTANATCAVCGGRMRGTKTCSCDKPDWRVKGKPLDSSANAERMRKQQESHRMWLTEAYRALRPGGVIKAFSGSRTFHRLGAAMSEVGFIGLRLEAWTYGSGFPKSLNVSKAIDKAAGAVRGVVGRYQPPGGKAWNLRDDRVTPTIGAVGHTSRAASLDITAPATPEAQRWDGWGTALKPAWEPVIVGRKPCG